MKGILKRLFIAFIFPVHIVICFLLVILSPISWVIFEDHRVIFRWYEDRTDWINDTLA